MLENTIKAVANVTLVQIQKLTIELEKILQKVIMIRWKISLRFSLERFAKLLSLNTLGHNLNLKDEVLMLNKMQEYLWFGLR